MPPTQRSLRPVSVDLIRVGRKSRAGEVDQAAVRRAARKALLGLGPEDRARLLELVALAAAMLADRWQQAEPGAPVEQWLSELAGAGVMADAAGHR